MRRAGLMLFALALAGCERGCLLRWISDKQESVQPAPVVRGQQIDLGGTDCSDGLLRCNDGDVEASRMAHLPSSCGQQTKSEKQASACTCPWDVVLRCANGCADETSTATATDADAGAFQLCRPRLVVARPILAEDHATVDVCSDEGITCREGIISACDAPASPSRPIAHCIFGCATGISLDNDDQADGPSKNPDGPISILCLRNDAERR